MNHVTLQVEQTGERALGLRLGKNALWLLLARLGTQVLMVLFTLLVARRLGEAGLGAYAFIAAVIFFGNIFTTFGTDTIVMREVAARRDVSRLPGAIILQLSLSVLLLGAIYISAPALPGQSPEIVRALQWYGLALLPLAFYTVFSAFLRGSEKMQAYMWLNLAVAALQAGLAWLFIHPGSSMLALVWILLVTQVSAAIFAGVLCHRQIPEMLSAWQSSGAALPALLVGSAPVALLGLFKVLYQKLSVVLLATWQGAAVTGWFSAALRTVEASQIGHIALLGALFPLMAQAHFGRERKTDLHTQLLSRSWWLLIALGTAAAASLYLLAPQVVSLLYGARFEPAIPALRLLAWMLIPYSVNIYLSTQLLSSGNERSVAYGFALSLLVLSGLNAWWIPRWGLLGACLSLLMAETIQSFLFLSINRFLIRKSEPNTYVP